MALRIGKSASVGCGWIAVYNALCILGYEENPTDIIRYFCRRAPIWNGLLGTFITNPAGFFRKKGYTVETSGRKYTFDRILRENDVCILFFFWRQKFCIGAHFIALHYRDGNIKGYNTFQNSNGPDDLGENIKEFLESNRYYFPVLTGIRKNKQI